MNDEDERLDYSKLAKHIVKEMNDMGKVKITRATKQKQIYGEILQEMMLIKAKLRELENNESLLRATIVHLNFKLAKSKENVKGETNGQ
jgi:hypothetical protein